jgi:hypothetical protein
MVGELLVKQVGCYQQELFTPSDENPALVHPQRDQRRDIDAVSTRSNALTVRGMPRTARDGYKPRENGKSGSKWVKGSHIFLIFATYQKIQMRGHVHDPRLWFNQGSKEVARFCYLTCLQGSEWSEWYMYGSSCIATTIPYPDLMGNYSHTE